MACTWQTNVASRKPAPQTAFVRGKKQLRKNSSCEVVESTVTGAPIMDDSEEAELTDEQAWGIVQNFIVSDHVPAVVDVPAVITGSAQ